MVFILSIDDRLCISKAPFGLHTIMWNEWGAFPNRMGGSHDGSADASLDGREWHWPSLSRSRFTAMRNGDPIHWCYVIFRSWLRPTALLSFSMLAWQDIGHITRKSYWRDRPSQLDRLSGTWQKSSENMIMAK
jgi:hypothetical protein